MIPALFLLFVILLAVHMARPRYRRHLHSAARFFRDLPPPRLARAHLRLAPPRLSRAFLLQLLAFIGLALAILLMRFDFLSTESKTIRLHIFFDTSASMTALEDGVSRFELAKQDLGRWLDHLQDHPEWDTQVRLSAFDAELRALLDTANPAAVRASLSQLQPRALPTDTGLIHRQLSVTDDFEPTHILVISDQPHPGQAPDPDLPPILWSHIGQALAQAGLTQIQGAHDPLTGVVGRITVRVTAYGPPSPDLEVTVTDPNDQVLTQRKADFIGPNFSLIFEPKTPGPHQIQLSPGDAYLLDDQATVQVAAGEPLRVDWRLPDRSLPNQIGWIITDQQPDLRIVTQFPDQPDAIPTLVCAQTWNDQQGVQIQDFRENHPLLDNINLDAFEAFSPGSVSMPEGFTSVLRGADDVVWIAENENICIIPGLPQSGIEGKGPVSTTIFFNAVRHLLRNAPPQPLFAVTDPMNPQPSASHIPLHPGEGNTWRNPASFGEPADLTPSKGAGTSKPWWPILLTLCVLFLVLERTLNLFGGSKWR